jgi:uncharacterized protein with ACT and thioredoxin-like domain
MDAVGDVRYVMNTSNDVRKIGPAIVRDMTAHITEHASNSDASLEQAVTGAVASYVFPQLEGVRKREQVVAELATVDSVVSDRLQQLAADVLQVEVDG